MALMLNAVNHITKPVNSPFVSFAKGTKERELLKREIVNLRDDERPLPALPLWINGPVYNQDSSKSFRECVVPHDHSRILAKYTVAKEEHVHKAVETVLAARENWSQIPWPMRLHIFQEAARLIETKYLYKLVVATMEDYSKNPFEAFIDVQELIDFLNFNSYYASLIYAEQPDSDRDTNNMLDYLPLEGFIFAVSPNNFIAINGNLCTAPLMMGNVVIAKPSSDVVYSFNLFLNILLEAGLPRDVLAVLYGDSKMIGDILLEHEMLSGIHFTGGTDTFDGMWRKIGANISKYRNYPKIVGETGGKDAIVVYDDHDPVQTAISMAVGAFGAQGRKCSATSRAYMTPEMWERVKPNLYGIMDKIRVGDVADFRNFMGAIINEREYKKNLWYIEAAKFSAKFDMDTYIKDPEERRGFLEMYGGEHAGDQFLSNSGWFIRPTVIVVSNPNYKTMKEEIFGPVLTICLLPKEKFESGEILDICDKTSPYALTGAIHTSDMFKFCEALHKLRFAFGNVYDDRTTAAMVNSQPFSGPRKSGTNSKVGWIGNMRQWVSPRTICLRKSKTVFPPAYLDSE